MTRFREILNEELVEIAEKEKTLFDILRKGEKRPLKENELEEGCAIAVREAAEMTLGGDIRHEEDLDYAIDRAINNMFRGRDSIMENMKYDMVNIHDIKKTVKEVTKRAMMALWYARFGSMLLDAFRLKERSPLYVKLVKTFVKN